MWRAERFIIHKLYFMTNRIGKEEFIVKNLKKLLAIVVCIAMMVPTMAFAATPSVKTTQIAGATAKSVYYTGKTQTVKLNVTAKGANGKTVTLVEGKDYKVVKGSTKALKAGKYQVTVEGIGKYAGKKTVTYTVAAKDLAPKNVSATASTKTYNGKKQATTLTLKYNGKVLKNGVDYKVVKGYTKATNAGKYKITIAGKGNFRGTKTVYYTVKMASQKSVKVTTNSSKKKVVVTGVKGKAKVSYSTNNSKVTVSKGVVKVAKGVKKGTKVQVTVKVAATKNYHSTKKVVTYVVK